VCARMERGAEVAIDMQVLYARHQFETAVAGNVFERDAIESSVSNATTFLIAMSPRFAIDVPIYADVSCRRGRLVVTHWCKVHLHEAHERFESVREAS
jgi:hypothetical protein